MNEVFVPIRETVCCIKWGEAINNVRLVAENRVCREVKRLGGSWQAGSLTHDEKREDIVSNWSGLQKIALALVIITIITAIILTVWFFMFGGGEPARTPGGGFGQIPIWPHLS